MSNFRLPNDIEALFHGETVRRVRLGKQWLYSAVDLICAVTERPDAPEYWEDLKRWEPSFAAMCRTVKIAAADGTWTPVDVVNIEQGLRLLQSIHSPKAERIKLWLAEAGRQRMEELANPELAIKRTRTLYEQKGYARHWIEKRLRGMGARQELTGQWYRRGAAESEQFRTLTNELTAGTFGMDVQAYKRYKDLRSENLRDHMSDLELALTTLSETTAAIFHQDRDSKGLQELERDVRDAGEIASQTRFEIERRLGKPVVSRENHLKPLFQKRRRPMAEPAGQTAD